MGDPFQIKLNRKSIPLLIDWENDYWKNASALEITNFHPLGSDHRPRTQVRVVYNEGGLGVLFRVDDCFISCENTEFQSQVSHDSCVEFFLQPKSDKGYFNFEINCGGALLLYYIEDPRRDPTRSGITPFVKATKVDWNTASSIQILHSLPKKIETVIEIPTTWYIQSFVPFEVMEKYVGKLKPVMNQIWKANFYKCGSVKPHWGSWLKTGEKLNFHQPEYFGPIQFVT
jgi:hypothetical protein